MTHGRRAPAEAANFARLVAACTSWAAIGTLAGCGHNEPAGGPQRGAPSAAPSVQAVPVDHLAADELLEGPSQAFGLTLPRGMRIDGAFADVTYASGRLPMRALVGYVRSHVEGGALRQSDAAATFEHVRVPGHPARELRVHAELVPVGVSLEVRDTTPPPAPNLPDDSARWRQVGLTPNGRLADPTHLD
jgi:hypothetical protein